MLQFKATQRKMYRPPGLVQSRKQMPRHDSLQILEHSIISRLPDRNNENINVNLISNFNQIKQLIRERKNLLKAKYESMLNKNRQKIQSISMAREQDLRNQAKMLNDRSILDLVDHAQSLNKSKSLMQTISEIKNMSSYDSNIRNYGKQFWDKHKQFEREKKKKAEIYHSYSKQLKDLNQRQRNIFNEIENSQNQIVYHLTKGRNDPDHVSRAQKLSDDIERRKNLLRDIKAEKTKIKLTIEKIIEDILEFNNVHEKAYENRIKQLDQIFIGTQNITEFDNLLGALQKIMTNRNIGQRMDNIQSGDTLGEYYAQYDNILQDIQKMKQEEDQIFAGINDQMRENIKMTIIQKSFFSGMPLKIDPNELFKKLKDYRKLLIDFSEQRPRLRTQINKMNQMNNALYPIKRDYETQDVRRQDLKRELKRLFSLNSDLELKEKQQRNSVFNLQQLLHKRNVIEADINDLAEKVNLSEYKTKMRQLEEVNRKITEKNDVLLQDQINRMRTELEDSYNRLYQNYEDLISQVQIKEEQPSLGVFLSKLEKRLSLI